MHVFAESIADECGNILLYLLQYVLSKKEMNMLVENVS